MASSERRRGIMGQEWCYECGQDRPAWYEAVYTTNEGGIPFYLTICADCGRGMTAEAFASLVLATFPRGRGRIELRGDPTSSVRLPVQQ